MRRTWAAGEAPAWAEVAFCRPQELDAWRVGQPAGKEVADGIEVATASNATSLGMAQELAVMSA